MSHKSYNKAAEGIIVDAVVGEGKSTTILEVKYHLATANEILTTSLALLAQL